MTCGAIHENLHLVKITRYTTSVTALLENIDQMFLKIFIKIVHH